jgi:hypothetical protein
MVTISQKSIVAGMVSICFSAMLSAQNAQRIIGKWKNEADQNKQAEFFLAKDNLYYGKLIAENGKTENIGRLIMKKLQYDEQKRIFTGTLSPPDIAFDLNATVSFVNDNKLKVEATKFFMTKTVYFIRIN